MRILLLVVLCIAETVSASSSPYVPQVNLDLQYGKVRNYGRASLLVPFSKEGKSLAFLNIFGLGDSLGATEGNIGLGYRQLQNECIYGAYIFYDVRKSAHNNMYNQITFGIEHLRDKFEVRLNGYVPIGRVSNKSE